MKTKKLKLLFSMISLILTGCVSQNTAYPTKNTDLKAVITSDLHYVSAPSKTSSIVPLVSHSSSFMSVFTQQIIDEKPDVFIATGDLTNDGNPDDIQELAKHLKSLKDAGIYVLLTTGNHDYGQKDISDVEKYLYPLLPIDQKDSASLSYSAVINDICFLAMDDGYKTHGEIGSFSKETMKWMEERMIEAKNNSQKIIFLSHHSVLYKDTDKAHRYTITNKNLKKLLHKYNVQLCFTGHQHTQVRYDDELVHEIISAMPLSGSHIFGVLNIHNQDISYKTENIDFDTYADSAFLNLVKKTESEALLQTDSVYRSIFIEQNYSNESSEEILTLFKKFLLYTQDGVIYAHYNEILEDPNYQNMVSALHDYNYGPWIETIMKNPPLDAGNLAFQWK